MEVLKFRDPHWEALTKETNNTYHLINTLPFIDQFYLAGGTGLALHLGHRFSVDLDFFSPVEDAVGPDQRALLRELLDDPTLEIIYDKDTTFVVNRRGVGISFFRHAEYPLIESPSLLEGILIASLAEIGAMKLAATINRGTRKDLVDLYYILQRISLDEIFKVASKKYYKMRSFPVSATRGLCYFEDAEAIPMPKMLDRTPWAKMKKFLVEQAMEAGRKHLQDLWDQESKV